MLTRSASDEARYAGLRTTTTGPPNEIWIPCPSLTASSYLQRRETMLNAGMPSPRTVSSRPQTPCAPQSVSHHPPSASAVAWCGQPQLRKNLLCVKVINFKQALIRPPPVFEVIQAWAGRQPRRIVALTNPVGYASADRGTEVSLILPCSVSDSIG